MSKAGPSLLRATFVRAADPRKQDPQLARIYDLQMTERGATSKPAASSPATWPNAPGW